jgi:hypothetical protein
MKTHPKITKVKKKTQPKIGFASKIPKIPEIPEM